MSIPRPRLLCLASSSSRLSIASFAATHGLVMIKARTNKAAIRLLKEATATANPFKVVVSALGTNKSTIILDQAGDRSTLISLAHEQKAFVVVYSHTACRSHLIKMACYDAGADIVLNSEAALTEAYSREVEVGVLHVACDGDILKRYQYQHQPKQQPSPGPNLHPHPSIQYRTLREGVLALGLKPSDHVQHQLQKLTKIRTSLEQQLQQLQRPLLRHDGNGVRCVFISDTHTHHKLLRLPPGDVLLHAGDAVGNYGDQDIHAHFDDYIEWLCEQASLYQHVVFVAGNHDTLLDGQCYNDQRAKTLIREKLPSNVHYLEHEGLNINVKTGAGVLRTIRLFGCPITASRQESMGKRYYSDAFERTNKERKKLWKEIPGGVDVLLTHSPPTFDDLVEPTYANISLTCYGDPLLTKALNQLTMSGIVVGGGPQRPPRFHCFGHDHDGFGVAQNIGTTFLNGAQEGILKYDLKANRWRMKPKIKQDEGIGCPLLFDC
mgnify:CR=1 FL=1|jgi:hypothetical protein